ncbi:putative ribonuclease H-like domain-containing protein [Tanacetum coccineum]
MLSNSPLSLSSQSTYNKDVDEVPGKGVDDLSERNEGYANSTIRDSTTSLSVSTAGPSINTTSENINTGSLNINTASPIPNNSSMQSLDNTGIFDDAYDDREVGADAYLNNLETTMNVSPIPTTRIHKDHPKDQIIGDINSATQIRRMTKILEEHAMVSYIKKQEITNHKDYQNCLFACFLSQIEPNKVIQDLTDLSWIEAMQEELLQFKLQKKDERGIVVRNKARLVAQCYTQEEGIDYDEVFAPVARIEAIRLFLAYASFIGVIVYQMDVNSAFLYGTTEEEVYVCQPPGFEDPQFPDKVYKVEKALYGLHQAPRAYKQNKDEEAEDVDVHLYRSMIGSLMYLTASKPNIMFVVCACERFQVTPKTSHLYAVKRIFRYLKGQAKLGLWYPRDSPFDLEAFSDSDYAGASLDKKSTTGGCQFLNKMLILWQCKKQTIVANSTTEAEYVVAAHCCGQTKKPRKAKRTTEISQSSGPVHLVVDQTVYKEWEDKMERAATTGSSLEAEQGSSNINRTQSMATLNESFP